MDCYMGFTLCRRCEQPLVEPYEAGRDICESCWWVEVEEMEDVPEPQIVECSEVTHDR